MKMNKFLSIIVVLSMIISMFSLVTVSAATLDDLAMTYTFVNELDGDADGTITISGIDATLQAAITNVDIYWGKSATERLENYYNIANYTLEGHTADNKDYDATTLAYTDNTLAYTFVNGRLIPEGATHVIADVITADGTKQLSVEIPANKRLNADKSEMLYNMVWSSDFHAENSALSANSHERVGIQDFVELAAMGREVGADKFKGVIFNGDIANSAIDYEYAIIEDLLEEYDVDFPFYYATGNHDTSNATNGHLRMSDAFEVRFDKLKKQFGLTFDHSDLWSYETYIGGHHYIFLSSPYITNFTFSTAQQKWLEEKICYDEKSGIPTFVFTHMPWESSGLTRRGDSYIKSTFDAFFERHPSAMVITSHVHMEPNSDQITYNIATPGHTPAIDTGAVTYNLATPGGTGKYQTKGGHSKYLEFYEDRIIMRTRNHYTKQWVAKADHIIYIDDFGKTIEGDFEITSNGAAGVIAAGDVLTAKLAGAVVDTNTYSINWYDMLGNVLQEGGTTYTVATADASVSAKITRADGAYAWAVARHGKDVTEYVSVNRTESGAEGDIPADSLDFSGPTTVKYYGDVVYLYGSVDAAYAGQDVTMVLMAKKDYPDMSKAKYFGTCTVASSGDYMFKFKASDVTVGDIFLVKAGTSTLMANYVSQKGALEEIVEVTPYIDDDNMVSLELNNKYADAMKAKIIVAMYDYPSGVLSKTMLIDYDLAFAENGEIQSWLAEAAVDGGKTVKIFLWSDLVNIIPLSNEDDLGVSAVISTETTETTEEVTE